MFRNYLLQNASIRIPFEIVISRILEKMQNLVKESFILKILVNLQSFPCGNVLVFPIK